MTAKDFVCRTINYAFNSHFRQEVKRMKLLMVKHAQEIHDAGCAPDGDIYSYFKEMSARGYSHAYTKAILTQASIELAASFCFSDESHQFGDKKIDQPYLGFL